MDDFGAPRILEGVFASGRRLLHLSFWSSRVRMVAEPPAGQHCSHAGLGVELPVGRHRIAGGPRDHPENGETKLSTRSGSTGRACGSCAARLSAGRRSAPGAAGGAGVPARRAVVGRSECPSTDLASEVGHLVAQHDDLDRQVNVLTTAEPDQLGNAPGRRVQERESHNRVFAASGVSRQSPTQGPRMEFSAPTATLV
jgi:hypothetical protein